MMPSVAGKGTCVLAGVAALQLLATLAAGPALADMDMLPPLEEVLPPLHEAEPSCCWGLEDMDPLRVLLIVTVYVMICHMMFWSAFRIILPGVHVDRGGDRLVEAPAALTLAWAAGLAQSAAGIARAGSGRLRLRGIASWSVLRGPGPAAPACRHPYEDDAGVPCLDQSHRAPPGASWHATARLSSLHEERHGDRT